MKICLRALLLVLAGSLVGCINISGWKTVQGTGRILTENRPVAGFNRVSVSGAGELIVTQGEEESLTIEADDNLLPLIRSEISHGHLSIGPWNVNLRPTQTIHYRLQLRDLNELHVSGSVQANADQLKTDRLALHISGSGKIEIAHLECHTLASHISGSGSTLAAGQADRQQIEISGSGNHRASELRCAQAKAHISGSGHATLWAVESLSAHISGSGRIEYRGRPALDSHLSGSGRVRHLAGAD